MSWRWSASDPTVQLQYVPLNDINVVQLINIQRLRWLGHVVRMEDDVPARRVFDAGIGGSRRRGSTLYPLEELNRESPFGDTKRRRGSRSTDT